MVRGLKSSRLSLPFGINSFRLVVEIRLHRFTNVRDEGGYKKDLLPKAQEPIKQAGGKY